MTTFAWLDEMLQRMAAESTGMAAPIHLQGEPMENDPYAVTTADGTEHRAGVRLSRVEFGADAAMQEQGGCTCGWSGPWHKPGMVAAGSSADSRAHIASVKLGEEQHAITNPAEQAQAFIDYVTRTFAGNADPEHLHAYAAKRAEWLQAVHDADVADRAARAAYKTQREATELYRAAANHRAALQAATENLEGELLALVKGEQA